MFYKQFEMLCKKHNTTPTKFTKDILKLSSSKVTAWKNGSIPKYEILQSIANYFDVTVGFLFDGLNQSVFSELNEKQKTLIDNYNNLNKTGQDELVRYSKYLLENPIFKATAEDNKIVS